MSTEKSQEWDQSKFLFSSDDFVSTTQKFDQQFDTKTLIGDLTFSEIIDQFNIINYLNPADVELQEYVKQSFDYDNTDTVDSDQFSGRSHSFSFLNTVYEFITLLRNGEKFFAPIHLHMLDEKRVAVHPGSKRLLMYSVYAEPVTTIITDYTGAYQNSQFVSVDRYDYSNCFQQRSTKHGTFNEVWRYDFHDMMWFNYRAKDIKKFKEVVVNGASQFPGYAFGDPCDLKQRRVFKKQSGIISCNSDPFMKQYTDEVWKFIL